MQTPTPAPRPVFRFSPSCMRDARKAAGLTQVRLGELLHVTSAQVSRWEIGASRITTERLAEVSNFLDVHPANFFVLLAPFEVARPSQDAAA